MIDALYNGISGLNTYQGALNTESNNIANVNTVAFKSDKTSFADMMYQNGFGKGGTIASIEKDFSQGNIKITNNNYDMAIMGDGYFQVKNNANEFFYTRAGNFRMANDGTLQTSSGLKVQGLTIEVPSVVGTNANINTFGKTHTNFLLTKNITFPTKIQTINAKATNYQNTATSSGVSGDNYKTASSKLSDITTLTTEYSDRLNTYASNLIIPGTSSVAQTSQVEYKLNSFVDNQDTVSLYIDGTQYLQSFSIDKETTLKKLSDQISGIKGFTSSVDTATGILTITSLVPGKSVSISGAKINDVNMDSTTTVPSVDGTGLGAFISARDALKNAIENAGGEFIEITNEIDLTKGQALNLTDIQLNLDTLNLSTSKFGDFEMINGVIYMKQDNNKFVVGKLETAMFNDNIGLDPQGDNLYIQTKKSGAPIYSDNMNKIENKKLELSNSNLSEGLVNLMVFQRSFEANSKSITTSDELLKTAIQLKK